VSRPGGGDAIGDQDDRIKNQLTRIGGQVKRIWDQVHGGENLNKRLPDPHDVAV
jgi:hypothetical protein